ASAGSGLNICCARASKASSLSSAPSKAALAASAIAQEYSNAFLRVLMFSSPLSAAVVCRRSAVSIAIDFQAVVFRIRNLKCVEFVAFRDCGTELVGPVRQLGVARNLKAEVQFGRPLHRFAWLEHEEHARSASLVPSALRPKVCAYQRTRPS